MTPTRTRRALSRTIALDAAAWAALQVAAGYAVHRLPDDRLRTDGWLLRERGWERGGSFYARRLRIRRWQPLLPEAGAAFPDGFDKRRLRSRSLAYLERYAVETRRAELGHWLSILPAPAFALWNPPPLAAAMALYALAVNLPCIASQRFNRIRVQRVLARGRSARANGSRAVVAARSRSSRGTTGSNIP